MADATKACSLTEYEIEVLIMHYGHNLLDRMDEKIERMNYLNKRLKAFKEPETEVKTTATAPGWGTPPKE